MVLAVKIICKRLIYLRKLKKRVRNQSCFNLDSKNISYKRTLASLKYYPEMQDQKTTNNKQEIQSY